MKLLISLAVIFASSVFLPWSLALIPFYTYSGLGLPRPVGPEWMWMQSVIELVVGIALLIRWTTRPKRRVELFLFALPLLSLPGLAQAANIPFALFLTMSLLGGVGYFSLWSDSMEWQLRKRVPELACLIWILLGFFIKGYESWVLDLPWWTQRSGGVWAASHGAGLVILLIPFVRNPWIIGLSVLYALLSLSRGVLLALALMLLLYFLIGYRRPVIATALAVVAAILTASFFMPPTLRHDTQAFFTERFIAREATLDDGTERVVSQRIQQDERWRIFRDATALAELTDYAGVGLGNFQWALPRVGSPPIFSNAHNVFLTSLVEGGIFFLAGFLALMAYALALAVRLAPRVAIALATWCLYGLFNAQLWEAAGTATAGDYLTLLFVIAYLVHLSDTKASLMADKAKTLA